MPRVPDLLISAVDTNRSRQQLQQGFWTGRLLAASTKDLRAEVLRCGPPGEGRCLCCFNPPEVDLPDDVRREQLRTLAPEELEAFAREIGHPVALVRRWAEEGGCSTVGDAALARTRADDEPATMFAVGFVSVMAGALLAVETIKEHIGRPTPLDDGRQNAKFQFEHPAAERNGRATAVQRDPNCSACAQQDGRKRVEEALGGLRKRPHACSSPTRGQHVRITTRRRRRDPGVVGARPTRRRTPLPVVSLA